MEDSPLFKSCKYYTKEPANNQSGAAIFIYCAHFPRTADFGGILRPLRQILWPCKVPEICLQEDFNMKRLIVLILAAVLLLGVLSGCSGRASADGEARYGAADPSYQPYAGDKPGSAAGTHGTSTARGGTTRGTSGTRGDTTHGTTGAGRGTHSAGSVPRGTGMAGGR
jgi:hypothetical protein